MTGHEAPQPGWLSTRKLGFLLFAIWLVTALVSLIIRRNEIPLLNFNDPDDAMRLVQVRDFLAGQSWFDVSQHRANPPQGGPMHWSRLVDLPIAGFILLLRPLVGHHWAEVGAVLLVPAMTLAILLAALYWAVRPLMGKGGALLCCALFATSPVIVLIQCAAMRIDHHAWQIVMMALALGGTLHINARRGGLVAGFAMATWLHISGEGLPFAAMTGGVMACRYAIDREEWPRIAHYVWALFIASVVLLLVTHGWEASLVSYCDAMSPVYLLPLAAVALAMTAGHMLLDQTTRAQRLVTVGLPGAIAIAIFLATGKQCFAGPFATLDPQVLEFWYDAVVEGLPIWKQDGVIATLIVVPSLLGVIGYLVAISRETNCLRRRDWLSLLALEIGAIALSILVMRTMSLAHLLAIPGNALLVMALHKSARSFGSMALRIPATASLPVLFPLIAVVMTVDALSISDQKTEYGQAFSFSEITALNRIEPATLFAPLDIGPDILLHTRNSIVGTGHHRNVEGLKLVISAFLAPPEQAHAIVRRSSATYLLVALTTVEMKRYQSLAPDGLAAHILAGNPPAWLTPVFVPGLKTLRLYRIDRSPAAEAMPAPA